MALAATVITTSCFHDLPRGQKLNMCVLPFNCISSFESYKSDLVITCWERADFLALVCDV